MPPLSPTPRIPGPGSRVPSPESLDPDAGFSLPEVLIAAGIMAGALAVLATLFTHAVHSGIQSRDRTYATVLARQGVERLIAIQARAGAPLPLAGLDYLDGSGRPSAPGEAAYVRRWSVEPLAAAPGAASLIRVAVARATQGDRSHDAARMTVVRRRAS